MRRMAERLLKNSYVVRKLPSGAKVFVSPGSQLKYLGRNFDRELIGIADRLVKPGMTVWDIGANCGVFAFSCRPASKIVAVEADPFLANLLTRSSSVNDLPVTIVSAAVADRQGLATFQIAGRGRAANHLAEVKGSMVSGGSQTSLAVPTITLDDLMVAMGPPDVIKIDIEGSEPLALQGATRVLNVARPVIYIEIDSTTAERTKAPLDAAGYRMELVEGDNWLAHPPSR